MKKWAYYNDMDPYVCEWVRNLIKKGHIPDGIVDSRSIADVQPDDVREFAQCHWFCGIAGWALAARLAGWPDDRELWTGSAPCQPFSVAGKGKAQADDRHLWPDFFRIIGARRPAVVMGEQVAAAVGKGWIDGVFADLESVDYACRAVVVPACAVDGPHRRDRIWFVADGHGAVGDGVGAGLEGHAGHDDDTARWPFADRSIAAAGCGGVLADADIDGWISRSGDDSPAGYGHPVAAAGGAGDDFPAWHTHGVDEAKVGQISQGFDESCGVRAGDGGTAWANAGWIIGHDGKARRVGTRIRRVVNGLSAGMVGVRPDGDAEEVEMIPLLAHGVPARVGKLRAFGNAIVPQVAAEVIGAYLDCRP